MVGGGVFDGCTNEEILIMILCVYTCNNTKQNKQRHNNSPLTLKALFTVFVELLIVLQTIVIALYFYSSLIGWVEHCY